MDASRALAALPALPVLDRQSYLDKLREVVEPMVKIRAMYNSLVGGVVLEPELMTVPIHDRAVNRGHACFDTCTLTGGRLYRLDIHLDRHLTSVSVARIRLPFEGGLEENRTRMRQVVAQTCVASGCRDASVRFFTSAGPGSFAVLPDDCTSAFYVVILERPGGVPPPTAVPQGIAEYTVQDVPLKPTLLAEIKSTNYMLNVLAAMSAQDRGGQFGIMLDAEGNIAEGSVKNCLFVDAERRLITPPFVDILNGTTVRRVLQLATTLVAEGLLTAVSQVRGTSVMWGCTLFLL